MRSAALLAVSSLLFLVGCTQPAATDTGDFEGEERAVAQTIADLAEAGRDREAVDICGGVVSEALRTKLAAGDSTCNDEVQKAIEDVDGFELTVEDVRVTGDTAEAVLRSTDRDREVARTFQLVREDDDWRIDSFG